MSNAHGADATHPLAGRTVLVTGGTGPLATRIARAARDRGARVTLASPVAATDPGAGVAHVSAAIDSESGIDRIFTEVVDPTLPLDTLIAVIEAKPLPALHETALERWRECVTRPLRTAFWLAQRALDEFLATGKGGRLIYVTDCTPVDSAGATNEIVEQAVASLVRSIAREYGRRGVACNAVLPAAWDTTGPGRDGTSPIVEQALFLASPDASFITGDTIRPRPHRSAPEGAPDSSAGRSHE